jgi:hypothetical protein
VNIVGFIILFEWLHKYLIERRAALNQELKSQANLCHTATVIIIDNSLKKDEITINLDFAPELVSSSSV